MCSQSKTSDYTLAFVKSCPQQRLESKVWFSSPYGLRVKFTIGFQQGLGLDYIRYIKLLANSDRK